MHFGLQHELYDFLDGISTGEKFAKKFRLRNSSEKLSIFKKRESKQKSITSEIKVIYHHFIAMLVDDFSRALNAARISLMIRGAL